MERMTVRFFAAGRAVPQGSTKGFVVNGKAVITSTAKGLGQWRDAVAARAQDQFTVPLEGAVSVAITFYLPRPTSYPKAYRPAYKRPDIDKLIRAVLDALTHIAWKDDAQVTAVSAQKVYTSEAQPMPGVKVTVTETWAPPAKKAKAS